MSISLNYIFYTIIKQGTSTTDSDNGQHAVQTTSEHAKYEMQKKKIQHRISGKKGKESP